MKSYMEFTSDDASRPEDLVLCIDVSPSMSDTDYKPSRLGGAQTAARALVRTKIKECPQDRVGLVTFDRRAKRVINLTSLKSTASAVLGAIDQIEVGMWTNLSAGLKESKRMLDASGPSRVPQGARSVLDSVRSFLFDSSDNGERPGPSARSKRILSLTDGDHNHGGDPIPVATSVKKAGVTIDVIGIGGSPSEVDEARLKLVASKRPDGSPRYWFISDTQKLVKKFEELATGLKPFREEAA